MFILMPIILTIKYKFRTKIEKMMEKTKVILGKITFNPEIIGGRACIRGMRITVALVLRLLSSDMSMEEILREYPDLELEDIQAIILTINQSGNY